MKKIMLKCAGLFLISFVLVGSASCGITDKSSQSGTATTTETTQDQSTITTSTSTSAESTAGTTQTTVIPTTTTKQTVVPTIDLKAISLDNYPVVDGSTACIPLAIGLIKDITGCSQAQAEESIAFNTTDKSYHAMAQGQSELLLVYAPAQPTIDELDVFNKMDMREIGLDALVFIVNEDNPVDSLTSEQVRGIYSGQITNWKDLGGSNIEIVPFQRPVLSGSQTLMLNLMMQGTRMMEAPTEIISNTMDDIIRDIASYNNTANAIGYSVYYYAKNMFTQPGLKFIAVDGVLPSNETINDQSYGFTNPFYGVIPRNPTPEAKAILDWLLTNDGQQLLADCGYVPILKLNR
jgi:phosphate transport system substrate-binding protein